MIGLNRVLVGDARDWLSRLSESSVDCAITSPPYYQLRDYGVEGQLGLEPTVGEWVSELRLTLQGLIRVLKPSGSLWLNLGDTYSRHPRHGAPTKGLLLAPERLLLTLAGDGWLVRNKVIWAKTNPMPHSVKDRLTGGYDVVYFLTRSRRYFFDLDAIRVPYRSPTVTGRRRPYPPAGVGPRSWGQVAGNRGLQGPREAARLLGKNPGDVWQLASASYRGQHFATFPPALVERPLLATCPERTCNNCGTPFRRKSRIGRDEPVRGESNPRHRWVLRYRPRPTVIRQRGALRSACACRSASRPGVVLDPFFGAGTVGMVAEQHRRDWLGIELNPSFARLAEERIAAARRAATQSKRQRRDGGTAHQTRGEGRSIA